MADKAQHPETEPDPDTGRYRDATIGAPRWVKVFGIIGLLVLVLGVVLIMGGHGPGRHMHGARDSHAPTALSVIRP